MSNTTSTRRRSSGAERPHQLAGLGIRNFPSMDIRDDPNSIQTAGKNDSNGQDQEVVMPTRLGHELRYSGDTPSPKTRYSPRMGSGSGNFTTMQTPPSPGMLYPFAQHGSSLSKFKTQSQVPSSPRLPYDHESNHPSTPTPRFGGSFGSTPGASYSPDSSPGRLSQPMSRRPTLLRTPPTDHPTGEVKHLTGDEGDEEEEYDEHSREEAEEGDSILPDLPMSPARFALSSQFPKFDHGHGFDQGLSSNVFGGDTVDPLSPRFGSYDPPLTPRNSIPTIHSRTGSIGGEPRIHARNLSLFFPQPGAERPVPGSPRLGGGEEEAPVTDISGRTRRKVGLGGDGSFSFGGGSKPGEMGPPGSPNPKVVGRRGHHHKHSLSHNFFSFLDPTVTNPNLASLDAPSGEPAIIPTSASMPTSASAAPRPMATTHIGGTRSSPNLAAPMTAPLLPSPISNPKASKSWLAQIFNMSPRAQLTLGFGVLEFFLGATIWVEGQALGSVGLTGLGYLVVFDALGVWVKLWGEVLKTGEGSTSTAEKPFGSHRKEALLYFVQSIFLLFSAMYIAKEALEIALMSGAGSEGGHGHGHGHGHSHGAEDGHETELPSWLLVSAALATFLSATVLHNHTKLVEAVGPAIMPVGRNANKPARTGDIGRYFDMVDMFLANPFSLAIVSCISIFLFGNFGLASHQMPKVERIMAFVEAGVAFWLAYPSSVVFGQVLLQTAPPEETVQMLAFRKAIRDIKDHPSVLRTNAPHIWQLTPHDPRTLSTGRTPGSTPAQSRRPSIDRSASTFSPFGMSRMSTGVQTLASLTTQPCVLVAELTVWVRDDLEDKAILDLTRYCYERCSEAVRAKHGRRANLMHGDASGEVTISVKREKELSEELAAAESAKHDHYHHDHHHHHDHHDHHHHHGDHDHTHEHHHHEHDEKKDHDHHHHDSCSHRH